MGILRALIQDEFDKKRDERLTKLSMYQAAFKDPNTPDAEKAKIWDLLAKDSPKHAKPMLDLFKPIILGAGKVGEALHIPGSKSVENAGRKHPKSSESEVPNPYSPEMVQAREAQIQKNNEQDLEMARKSAEQKARTDTYRDVLSRQALTDDLHDLAIRHDGGMMSDDEYNANITARGAAYASGAMKPEPMVFVSPLDNKQILEVLPVPKRPGIYLDPISAKVTDVPKGWHLMTRTQYDQMIKEPKAVGNLGQRIQSQEIIDNPRAHTHAEITAAKATLRDLDTKEKGQTIRIEAARLGLPGAFGDVAAPKTPDQKPMERLNKAQQGAVKLALNSLTGAVKVKYGAAIQNKLNEGLNLISSVTGLSVSEIQTRAARRDTDLRDYSKIKLIADNVEALDNSLNRHGKILTGLRSQLPNSDVVKINQWLISGSTSFNVGGVSEAAVRYGLALQAVRNEYARVIAGGAASIAQTPVEAFREAGRLMSEGFTSGQTEAMMSQIHNETQQKTGGYQEKLQSLLRSTNAPLVPELEGKTYEPFSVIPPPDASTGTPTPSGGKRPPLSSFEK